MRPNRSPWIEQLDHGRAPRPLDADADADVAVVGGGIAGVATAFFLLRDRPATYGLPESPANPWLSMAGDYARAAAGALVSIAVLLASILLLGR